MQKITMFCCLLLLPAVPAMAADLNCVDIELLQITPSVGPAKKQAIVQLQSHCPEGGYRVEAGLYTGLAGNPTPWKDHITTSLSYFGPNQTAPTKAFFAYDPEGIVKFKVEVKHNGDTWGEKIIDVPTPLTQLKPKIPKIEKPGIEKIPKPLK